MTYQKVIYTDLLKISPGIIFAKVVAFKPKAPLNAAFANYHNKLIYISL